MEKNKKEEIKKLDLYWNALNYLSVGQLYLLDNPLLKRPLEINDIKKILVGHWGTAPGQNFIYTHLNRIIKKYDLNMIYISGPGHGGQVMTSNSYLEGSYTKCYPNITETEEGLKNFFKQFSYPGGISSHASPETPGSIHEGGELGYSLSHAYGAILDNPDLIVSCVIGDGEAETGPLSASWNINKLIDPKTDGVVLPILHLNGYKIANPTIFGRMSKEEIESFFIGYGYKPYYLEGSSREFMHENMMKILDSAIEDILKIKDKARKSLKKQIKVNWPIIILKTPKGWTGPKIVDGKQIENTFRSHQIPLIVDEKHINNLKVLEKWLKSYHPEQLFDETGKLKDEIKSILPEKEKRMSFNPNTNGGLLLKELKVPDYKKYTLDIKEPGQIMTQDMMELGKYIKDILKQNKTNYRIFGPDEAMSNRLNYVFEVTNRKWNEDIKSKDEYLSPDGKVIDSILSEHICQGLLEGYLLTGRHGFIHSYEAFIRIVDSMASQHAKWLKMSNEIPWRKEISSLNYILTSHIWQQDHNGFTHQDPGFLNHMVTKKADTVRIYLPPDTNCLLSCFEHCTKTKNYINVLVASKHPRLQWFNKEQADDLCKKGIKKIDFASTDNNKEPDIVLVGCGDTPLLEVLAAAKILKENYKNLKIRVICVVDLMKLQSNEEHPHGLTNEEYNDLFTKDKHIIFNFHGYPNLIHQLAYKRENQNLHVHGYKEEGTITTPFDMRVRNEIDRYHIVLQSLQYINKYKTDKLKKEMENKLKEHNEYIKEYGKDTDEILNWKW